MTKLKDKEDEAWQSGHQYGRLEREKEILEIIEEQIKKADWEGECELTMLKSKIKGQK